MYPDNIYLQYRWLCKICGKPFDTDSLTAKHCESCKQVVFENKPKRINASKRGGGISQKNRQMIYQIFGRKCLLCDQPSKQIHHIVPICKDPSLKNDIDNLVPLCFDHHREQHPELPDKFVFTNTFVH